MLKPIETSNQLIVNQLEEAGLIYSNAVQTAKATRQTMDGKEHMVVPVVAIKTGVVNNRFYSSEQLKAFAHVWNGVPVPVGHPQADGKAVTANQPMFEEKTNIGKFYNVNFEDDKLKGEIWIDIDKAKRLGYEAILNHFDGGNLMEVSTGLFSEFDNTPGVWNGQAYVTAVKNIHPDHLALLPNEKGACSVEDGCGALRTNCDGSETSTLNNVVNLINRLLTGNQKQTEKVMDKEALVKSIIENKENSFEEKDKDTLMAMNEETLKKFAPTENKKEESGGSDKKDAKPETNEDEGGEKKEGEKTYTLSQAQMDAINTLIKQNEASLDQKRKAIVKHNKAITEDIAKTLSPEAVEAMYGALPVSPATFLGRGGSMPDTNTEEKTFKPTPVLLANLDKDGNVIEDKKKDEANQKEAA